MNDDSGRSCCARFNEVQRAMLEIIAQADRTWNWFNIDRALVQRNLERNLAGRANIAILATELANAGLITEADSEIAGLRVYAITDAGRKCVDAVGIGHADRDAIEKRLVADYDYTPGHASDITNDLIQMQSPFLSALRQVLRGRVVPELQIATFCFARLQAEYGMNPFAALLTLDVLSRSPQAGFEIEKGFDEII